MGNAYLLSLIWNKLGNLKIQIYLITIIFLYLITTHLFWYFEENGEASLSNISMNFLYSISIGGIYSGLILFFIQSLKLKKNIFINQGGIITRENFLRMYIIVSVIIAPFGIIVKN